MTFQRPYYPANLKHQPYPHWKVIALSWIANALGIQFKVDGIPYGAAYNRRPDYEEVKGDRAGSAGGLK